MDSRSTGASDATAVTSIPAAGKSRRDRNRDRMRLTAKAVVRYLPPAMTESEFLTAVQPLPPHNFFYFSKADHGLGLFSFSRAYINFLTFDDMESFRDKFDGYVFVDSKGTEFAAVVEFAPFQKIPLMYWKPASVKRDKKCGTVEEDSDYKSFLLSLEDGKSECLPSAEIFLEEMEARHREIKANRGCVKVITPLMEYVMAKYSGKSRARDERRLGDERKHRNREDKGKKTKKTDNPVKKERREKVPKTEVTATAAKGTKTGATRREKRNDKRRRDRREKLNALFTDPVPGAEPTVKVLQKEKGKDIPRPKTQQSAPASKGPAAQSQSNKQSEAKKAKPDRRPAPAHRADKSGGEAAATGAEAAKDCNGKARENGPSKKDRIPNKERPAIAIYRPSGAKRVPDTGAKKQDSDPKNREPQPANRNNKNSSTGPENKTENNYRPDRKPKPKPRDGPRGENNKSQSAPQPKPENGAPFRTKVFKSSRKPASTPTT